MILVEVVGWAGAVALLVAYGLVANGRVGAASRTAVALNVSGSAGLAANGAAHAALPSTVLNLIWLAIAVASIRAARRSRTATRADVP